MKISKSAVVSAAAISGVLLICLAVWLFICSLKIENPTAKIYSNGALLYSINLFDVGEPYEIVIKNPDNGGSNTIRVENGRIGVTDADCPDRVCVNTGFISDGAIPIICLPNRLEIRIESENSKSEIDGVAR